MKIIEYPNLAIQHLEITLPKSLGEIASPTWLTQMLDLRSDVPIETAKWVKEAVRDLLRHHGYKPKGRGKPSSEYLRGAATSASLNSINAAVDCGNVASLHSGLPISIIDNDLLCGTARIDVPKKGTSYIFNQSGQTIDVGGLLSLFDDDGPCANAVKDSQRTKTSDESRQLVAIVWAPISPESTTDDYARRTCKWLADLFAQLQ